MGFQLQDVGDMEDRSEVGTPLRELELRHVRPVERLLAFEVALFKTQFDPPLAQYHRKRFYLVTGYTVR